MLGTKEKKTLKAKRKEGRKGGRKGGKEEKEKRDLSLIGGASGHVHKQLYFKRESETSYKRSRDSPEGRGRMGKHGHGRSGEERTSCDLPT